MPFRVCVPLALALALALTGSPAAMAAPPQWETIIPVGCPAGESQTIRFPGSQLAGLTALCFSHPGIRAVAGEKGAWRVEVAADVPPGDYDVWAVSDGGMSVPRRIVVSRHAEVAEQEENNDLPDAAQRLAFPAAVTGRIEPATDRDCFRFELVRGAQMAIECRSTSLDGTVLPALTLFGPQGEELLHDDGRLAEPTLHFTAHVAGEYVVRVEERAFRKGANNVYRLVLHDTAVLAAAFPSAVVRGQRQTVTLYAAGESTDSTHGLLEPLSADIEPPPEVVLLGSPAIRTSALFVEHFDHRQAGQAGSVRLELVDRPPTVEQQEFADDRQAASELTLPAIVAGRFLARNDVDWFRFSAKKGQNVWIDAVAERSDRPLDLELAIHDAKGKLLETLTDTPQPKDAPARLALATLDPQGLFKAPADGDYFVAVRDLLGPAMAGPQRGYLLYIGPRQEQIALVAMPTAAAQGLAIPAGGKATLDVMVVRRGGHQAPIRVQASELPNGVTAKEVVIDGKKSNGVVTVEATTEAAGTFGQIELTATTELDGQPATLRVRPATTIREATPIAARFTQTLPVAVLPPAKKK